MLRNGSILVTSRALWRGAVVLSALATAPLSTSAEFLDQLNQALSIRDPQIDFQLQISGLVDLETYFIDQRPPGLIDAGKGFLFNPRLSIFVDAQWTKHLYFFGQVRVDRGFDPTDRGAKMRLDEYLLRYTPGDKQWVNFQVGKFATMIGNWVPRHDSWQNPFINAPLPYENLTSIWDIAAPDSAKTFLTWAESEKGLREPIIWGPSYTSGLAIFGQIGKFEYAGELKNEALSSRPEYWDATRIGLEHPTFSGRLGFRPNPTWSFGISASSGAYLLPIAGSTLPPGKDIGDYRELLLGQDISFEWHHWQIWAEAFETRFEVPQIGNADSIAYYVEAKYKITPQLFGALRWNQQLFGMIHDGDGGSVPWGHDISRVDAALGYRFTNYLQIKLQYSFSHQNAELQEGEQLVAGQLTLKF
jgi:hypothetical protein